jgi:hypothetical protein
MKKIILGINILIKCSFKHRIGNIIGSLVGIFEDIVIILSFGFIYPFWRLKFNMYRLSNKFLID